VKREKVMSQKRFDKGIIYLVILILITFAIVLASLSINITCWAWLLNTLPPPLNYAMYVLTVIYATGITIILICAFLNKTARLNKKEVYDRYEVPFSVYATNFFYETALFTYNKLNISRGYLPIFFKLFGARVGKNTAIFTALLNPEMISIGDNCVIGTDAKITGHSMEKNKIIFKPVIIEDGCTIGANSTLLPGCVIKRGSIVGANSLVLKNQVIPENTVWGGVPAKKIR